MLRSNNRRSRCKAFFRAVQNELRQNKGSFIVFSVLRLLIVAVLIMELLSGKYESAFYCILTFCLLYLPGLVQAKLRLELPPALEIGVFCFIFASGILGEVACFYRNVHGWDTALHTINGLLAAAVGFSMVKLLNDDQRLTFQLSPLFMALVAFCFSMTVGVIWEFVEFGADAMLHSDMQKDTIVHAIYSAELNPDRSNNPLAITGITSAAVNGVELGLGGYLDIGLFDTMKDLLVNFIGAVVFSLFAYFYVKSKGKEAAVVEYLVPEPKTPAGNASEQADDDNDTCSKDCK